MAEWLNAKEAAKRLGVSPPTLNRLVRDGELECVEYYGRRKYSEDAVQKCLDNHRVKGRPKTIWPNITYVPGMKLV